jgi:2'-5' RNA ligase
MPRLFLAADFDEAAIAELVRLQPPAGSGVRLTRPDQIHLTLHFLGEKELEPVQAALAQIASEPLSLEWSRLGKFGSPRRETILWAGLQDTPALQRLYATISEALRPAGYEPEPRPFRPHVTLARCKRGAPAAVIDAFLRKAIPPTLAPVAVREFSLYSSVTKPDGSVYRREGTVRLGIQDGNPKSECRNPKEIQSTKSQTSKNQDV